MLPPAKAAAWTARLWPASFARCREVLMKRCSTPSLAIASPSVAGGEGCWHELVDSTLSQRAGRSRAGTVFAPASGSAVNRRYPSEPPWRSSGHRGRGWTAAIRLATSWIDSSPSETTWSRRRSCGERASASRTKPSAACWTSTPNATGTSTFSIGSLSASATAMPTDAICHFADGRTVRR